jgi:type 1 fimbriae regulatory protein FimB
LPISQACVAFEIAVFLPFYKVFSRIVQRVFRATNHLVLSRFREAFMNALTQKEVIAVLRAAQTPRNRAMIAIAYRHGMRASKVCELKLADVDMKNSEITIRRLKGSLKTTQPLRDQQSEPLLSEKKLLRAWLRERGNHPSAYVFVSQKSARINRSQFYRIFSTAAEAAGLPADKRHPHCLKHALGFSLVAADEPGQNQTGAGPQEHSLNSDLYRSDRRTGRKRSC